MDRRRDAVRGGRARQHAHAVHPLPRDPRRCPQCREREQLTAVHLEVERLARLTTTLMLRGQPLEVPVRDLQRPPFRPADQVTKRRLRGDALHARVDELRAALRILRPRRDQTPAQQPRLWLTVRRDDRQDVLGGGDVETARALTRRDRQAQAFAQFRDTGGVRIATTHAAEDMRGRRTASQARSDAAVLGSGMSSGVGVCGGVAPSGRSLAVASRSSK